MQNGGGHDLISHLMFRLPHKWGIAKMNAIALMAQVVCIFAQALGSGFNKRI